MKRGLLILGIATALACAWLLRFAMHIPEEPTVGTRLMEPCPANWVLMFDPAGKDDSKKLRCVSPDEAREIVRRREI